MTLEELLLAAEANAQRVSAPVAVDVPGIGRMYVRKRTIREFEQMAVVSAEERKKEGKEEEEIKPDPNGMFAPSLARLLCNEDGTRFPADQQKVLTELFARQPEEVFHALIEAADGKTKKDDKKATEPGN